MWPKNAGKYQQRFDRRLQSLATDTNTNGDFGILVYQNDYRRRNIAWRIGKLCFLFASMGVGGVVAGTAVAAISGYVLIKRSSLASQMGTDH